MRHETRPAPLTLDLTCPTCGSRVMVQDCTVVEEYLPGYPLRGKPLPKRRRETSAAFCTGCEFVVDLRTSGGRDKSSAELLRECGAFVEGCRG